MYSRVKSLKFFGPDPAILLYTFGLRTVEKLGQESHINLKSIQGNYFDFICIISSLVLGADVRHDVLVEELENQRDAVGEYEVLGHELKLVNVIDLELFE